MEGDKASDIGFCVLSVSSEGEAKTISEEIDDEIVNGFPPSSFFFEPTFKSALALFGSNLYLGSYIRTLAIYSSDFPLDLKSSITAL